MPQVFQARSFPKKMQLNFITAEGKKKNLKKVNLYLKLTKLWINPHNHKTGSRHADRDKTKFSASMPPGTSTQHSLNVKSFMKSFTTCSQRG